MTDEEINTLSSDFDDFLFKVVNNYTITYSSLAGVILTRMAQLAQLSDNKDVLLDLLPEIQETLRLK